MIKKIVIITDCTDVAFNELYRTIDSYLIAHSIENYQIDPLVAVKSFSIENASFVLRLLSDLYGDNTIFHVVVNGTNKSPVRIFGRLKNGITFVGNNSGYFNWMIEDHGLEILYENKLNREINNQSFGGKHVGAPTVAKILSGESLDNLGLRASKEILPNYHIANGTIVHCDNFGLIKIKYSQPLQFQDGQKLKIFINGKYKLDAMFTNKWKTQAKGTWVLFPGSSLGGLPELGRVRCYNSAAEIDVQEGDIVTWKEQ